MKSTWEQIHAALGASPSTLASFRRPASDAEIARASHAIGIEFPSDFEASLRIHDGQKSDEWPVFEHWMMLPLDQIVSEFRSLEEFVDLTLIPIASNGAGDFQCICLTPDRPDGTIVLWDHETRKTTTIESRFATWLADIGEQLTLSASLISGSQIEAQFVPGMDDFASIVGQSIKLTC